jgi:phosphoglycolate phosphatase-like HAD superfamily hydrolase
LTDRRLYLFDIDATLIATGGAGSAAMRAAFTALWGIEDGFIGIEFSGRTDRAILRDALAATSLGSGVFTADLQRFKRAYFRRLEGMLRVRDGRVLPGVVDFLDRLDADDSATIGLGTGNFRVSAGIKLRYYGIDGYFRFGGFGDRSEQRADLIAQGIRAADRAAGRHGTVFVIGDTPHDINAAKANNAIAVGVATGTVSEEDLALAGADYVYPTLEAAWDLLPSSQASRAMV